MAIAFCALCTLRLGLAASPEGSSSKKLTASSIDSGFALSHATFNGMLGASDGRIYYVLCTESIDIGAQMYSYDPAMDKVRHLGDLTEASGEKGLKAIPQGKSHVNFVEWNGKLYFATHIGYYTIQNGIEKTGVPPPGYEPYPGGHFVAYDMTSGNLRTWQTRRPSKGLLR